MHLNWQAWNKEPMIVTEYGLTFTGADNAWRCIERPALWVLRSGRYCIEGRDREFPTLAAALAAGQAIGSDSAMATVGEIDRTENRGR